MAATVLIGTDCAGCITNDYCLTSDIAYPRFGIEEGFYVEAVAESWATLFTWIHHY